MLTVCDIHVGLRGHATIADIARLKDHFKALKIEAIGLDSEDFDTCAYELSFTVYGGFGPFMMKRVVQDCTQNIFPGSSVGLSHRG